MSMSMSFVKTPEQGCATTLVAALDPALSNAAYLYDCQVVTPSEAEADKGNAERLWELSERLVGQSFFENTV